MLRYVSIKNLIFNFDSFFFLKTGYADRHSKHVENNNFGAADGHLNRNHNKSNSKAKFSNTSRKTSIKI